MTFKSILATAFMSLCLVACSETNDEPEQPEQPTPGEPVETTITITSETLEISVGESTPIEYTVEPDTATVRWESSDTSIATVDEQGVVTGIAGGSVTVTAYAASTSASVAVKVVLEPKVGDYFYSDGTFSSTIDAEKTIIGVVFWTGDPTADDAALRREHPECCNGLVVAAFPSMIPTPWQSNASSYGSTTGPWVEANLAGRYISPVSSWGRDTRRNYISGYNNTCALELFNADPANAAWTITAINSVQQFRETTPAPASTSGWFLPGAKELTLLINSEYDGDVFDFNDVAADKAGLNKAVINKVLETIEGAEQIGSEKWAYDFWSSNDWEAAQTYFVSSFDGTVMCTEKKNSYNQLVRCVLAF